MSHNSEITCVEAQSAPRKNFAYREVGEVRGRYSHPDLLWHKHFLVQNQEAESFSPLRLCARKIALNPGLRRSLTSIAICYLMLFNSTFAADALHEVMDALSRVERSEVGYQEEKHLSMLDLPLVQTGSLSYVAPDQFSRSLDGLAASRFTVNGAQVTLEKMTGKETHDLNNLPMIKAFIASFGATLAGDLATLQQYYEISFDGALNDWRLDLQPRSTRLASYVTRVQLWGSHDRIKGMEIHETNGDWSQMILLHE